MKATFQIKKYLFLLLILCSSTLTAQVTNFSGLEFEKTIHDFGDIQITEGTKKCQFTFTNRSSKPVVIHNAISSCGCTEPTWGKAPILPNKKGIINVEFLNDQGPYPFDKSITLYISGQTKPIVLRIRGVVHDKKKSLSEIFPVKFGALALRGNRLKLGHIQKGIEKGESVDIANISTSPIKVAFTNSTPGLSISVSPNPIPANSKAKLNFSIDTQVAKGWGKNIYKTALNINGTKISNDIEIEAFTVDNFSNYTKEQLDKAPIPIFKNLSYNFDPVKQGTVINKTFSIKNMGQSPLTIYKAQPNEKGFTIAPISTIEPNREGKIDVTFDTSNHIGENIYVITLITNSPSRPLINVFISGDILK